MTEWRYALIEEKDEEGNTKISITELYEKQGEFFGYSYVRWKELKSHREMLRLISDIVCQLSNKEFINDLSFKDKK